MRQALNNLQSTSAGYEQVTEKNVYKVCDQPHPLMGTQIIKHCINSNFNDASNQLMDLWERGYSGKGGGSSNDNKFL